MADVERQKEEISSTEKQSGGDSSASEKIWSAGSLRYTFAGLVILFIWLLWGVFTSSLKDRTIPTTLQLLLKKFKASDLVAGIMMGSLPQIISIFISPIISYKSDRHRGRWGRRIPFLLIPAPFAFLSLVGLAYSPRIGLWLHRALGARSPGESSSIIICLGTFWVLLHLCSVVSGSVLTGFFNDVVPRKFLGRFFALFRVFSLTAGMVYTWFLMEDIEEQYAIIFIILGALYLIGVGTMCFFVREGEYPPPPPEKTAKGGVLGRFANAVKIYFRDCFSNLYYLRYFLSVALICIAFQPILLFYVFYAKDLGMSTALMGKYFTAQFLLSLLQAYPLGWLADRFHPIRVTIAVLALYGFITLLSFFLMDSRVLAFLNVEGLLMVGVIQVFCGTIAGSWSTATASLSPMLLPKMKFATFASAMGICASVGVMCASVAAGRYFDLINHDYRYIYLWAFIFTMLSLLALLAVYRKFMALGGQKGYVAPE
ncbi:MFS transporter [Candidatus Sumerlaeota bacterium]|nr:MFS transporter [Candidatus Sumerlaeota bacterium]